MYDVQQQYIQPGGIIYATKPYKAEVKAGNNRAIVKMLFVSGSNLRKNIIVWNDGADSVVTELANLSPSKDSIEIVLGNLEEGSYIFNVYNLDKDNNRSIKVQAIGNVYGDRYKSTLLNRSVNSITKNDTAMVISWSQPREGDNGVLLSYNDNSGNPTSYRVLADELTTYIKNWERAGKLKYATIYLPEENAIDEFPTAEDIVVMAK
jgi:hypothetical protein